MQEKVSGKYRPDSSSCGLYKSEDIVTFPNDQENVPKWKRMSEEELRQKPGLLITHFAQIRREGRQLIREGKLEEGMTLLAEAFNIDAWLTQNIGDWDSHYGFKKVMPVHLRGS